MNEKGFMAGMSVLIALTVSVIFLSSFQPLIVNKAQMNKNVKESIESKISSRNGLERLFSLYSRDISSNLREINYDDLGILYDIEEIDINYTPIQSRVFSGDTFYINNKTDLNIYFEGDSIDPEFDSFIDVDILASNIDNEIKSFETIYSNSKSLNSDWSISIDREKYGDYKIFYHAVNAENVNVVIEYNEQTYRKLKIKDDKGVERTLIIENDINDRKVNKYLDL